MIGQRAKEGYLQIDHRESPGVSVSDVAPAPDRPIVGAGVNYESATVRCTQCHRIGVLNPNRGQRQNYCAKCDGFHCDGCMVSQPFGSCLTLDARFDQMSARLSVRW